MLRSDSLNLSATGAPKTTALSLFVSPAKGESSAPQIITAGKRVIEVKGKAVNVLGQTQPGGSHGLAMNAGENFRVRLGNRIGEPTAIHGHGLTPPWQRDGVAGISEEPIPDGGGYIPAYGRCGEQRHLSFQCLEGLLMSNSLQGEPDEYWRCIR